LDDVTITLCAEDWQRCACDVHHPEEVGLDLFAKSSSLPYPRSICAGVARVIDEHEPAKGIYRALDGIACCACVGHVEVPPEPDRRGGPSYH
jgi:hypothetical protein